MRPPPAAVSAPAQRIGEVDVEAASARPTGVAELDRVLGGGLVPGAVVLLAGEPGVGKSTLLLEVSARAAREGAPTLYVTGEESTAQVRLRAGRTGAVSSALWLAAETDLQALLAHVDAVRPGLLVVDSVQTIASAATDGSAGGVTQVRAVTAALISVAKERGTAVVLVGHVTKDGAIAGPRLLEHLVDVVLTFEGDRHSPLRMVRAVKNRFGPADEVGCFVLGDGGIRGLPDPSGLFLTRRTDPVPGTCVTVTVEGRRPMPAEVQALVDTSALGTPRRAVSGLDSSRVSMVLAVLSSRAEVRLGDRDVLGREGGLPGAEVSPDQPVHVGAGGGQDHTGRHPGLPGPPGGDDHAVGRCLRRDRVGVGEGGGVGELVVDLGHPDRTGQQRQSSRDRRSEKVRTLGRRGPGQRAERWGGHRAAAEERTVTPRSCGTEPEPRRPAGARRP